MKKLLIVTNVDWFFISHRIGIGEKAVEEGWEVYVAAEDTGRSGEIVNLGIKFIDFPFSRSGTNVVAEFKTLINFFNLYKKINPDVVHHVTLKPVVYGSVAARVLKIKGVVNAIAGLGYNFGNERKGLVQTLLKKLMIFGFKRSNLSVIFQNRQDYEELKKSNILSNINNSYFTKGSGVDLDKFNFQPLPNGLRVRILFPTRMLWDKGVRELRKASDILKEKYYEKITFVLAGLADNENKTGVPASYLIKWEDDEYVKWIGYQTDMVTVYNQSDIVVLPSYYREGMPKSLIEAAAIGRPIITTNSIGCRECVNEGVNGLIVDPRNVEDLVKALEKLITNPQLREEMGRNSRKLAEEEFSQEKVVEAHMFIYNDLLES